MSDVCMSCKAPIVWALTERGKRMPVDAEPTEAGTVLLSHRHPGSDPVALYQSPEQIEQLRAAHDRSPRQGPLRLFVSHFATCPFARHHRRPRTSSASTSPSPNPGAPAASDHQPSAGAPEPLPPPSPAPPLPRDPQR